MKYFLLLFLFLSYNNIITAQELRGTWIARNSLSTKEALAQAMDSLAANNFNVVFINVWSRGYPLWKSELFQSKTGISIDPTYEGRDILAEAIAEGHKHGLHVEAWFEYGFVGGWTGNQPPGGKGPIFNVHPDWVAKKRDGGEIDNSNFYWMIHTHPDVQDFLIGLATEMCRNYDLDGIELDRIRYSSTQYGYDDYTDSLYRSEHSGNPPPENHNDSNWIRWRADKLNDFAARIYDSIKVANPKVNVSNAPSLYSSTSYTAYNSFCQDWVWWVNNNYIDNVQVQSYVGSAATFGNIIDYISTLIQDKTKVFPAFATKPGNNDLPVSEVQQMINVTRNKGYNGNAIWYYVDLLPYFSSLKNSVYSEKTHPPYSPEDWRELYQITTIHDTNNAVRYGTWINSNIFGYSGQSLYAGQQDSASVSYFFDVPVDGFYEVYAYQVTAVNRNEDAFYSVFDSNGNEINVVVNQKNPNNRRWYKLADVYLNQGRQKVFVVSNENLVANNFVSADAGFIKLNRRLSPDVVSVSDNSKDDIYHKNFNFNLKNYPNPFNNQTKIVFEINDLSDYKLSVFNLLGQELKSKKIVPTRIGLQELTIDTNNLSSGVYLLQLIQNQKAESIKIVLAK